MPKMIESSDKDDIAKRRTVMILDVLSGRTPVSDAIEQASISRAMYYQLESKALMAMLDALTPSESKTAPSPSASKALATAKDKIERLEQDKRRLERLLSMTTRVLEGPMKKARGRKRKTSSTRSNTSSTSSSPSTTTKKKRTKHMISPPETSTPTASGEAER